MSTPSQNEADLIRELRQSEARLREAVKAGNVGLWDWDLRTNRVSYSPEWKSQIGYEPHEISDDFSEWQSRVHPEDLERSLAAVHEFIATARPGYSIEFRFRHRDGRYRWILAQASLTYDEEGKPERMLGSHVDITAQKEAEEASKTEIRGIHECLVDGLLVVDAQSRAILRVNRAMCRLFGYSERDLMAMPATALHPPEEPPPALPYLDGKPSSERVAHGIACLRADGSVFRADIASHPIDLAGRACVIGLIRDVTERLRDEQRLQEQFSELAEVYKNSPVGLCVVDRDFRYVRINERLAAINGKSIDEHLGRTVHEVLPELADQVVKLWTPVFENGRPLLDIEIQGETPGAPHLRRSWLSSFFPLAGKSGAVTAVMVAVVDVTDLKRTELQLRESDAKYRALIETTDTGFHILDGQGRILDANQEYVRQSGHGSLAEILGRPVVEWTAPHDLARNERELGECLERGFTRNASVDYVDGSGRFTTIEVNATVVNTEAGTRILALTRDVTDRKRAESEREHLRLQLQHAQKMEAVGRLSGGVAHDFNNLLTVIKGNVDVAATELEAMTGPSRARLAATLEEIGQAAYRASHLTGQLLTFSRRHVTDINVVDLGAVIRGMQTMLRRLIREDIALEIDCGPGPHRINADRMQIEQALVNLAVNASDAMPDGGRLILRLGSATLTDADVTQYPGAAAGPYVVITVTDTGVGMDARTLDHLFEPFFTTKPYGAGTGLGLSIVYGIVQTAGGHIRVDSAPGRGSTFKLFLPPAHGLPPPVVDPREPAWERGAETILLCEDEASVRTLLRTVLTSSGYTVVEADNGEKAVQLARDYSGPIHVLVTDVVMPGLKGDRVAAAVLKERPAVRVLFMSGYASDVLSTESLHARSVEFLQKPFGPQVLLRRVREILDKAANR